jgi:hypothetical protein
MRILLDENIPFALRKLLGDHEVKHASEEGWDGLSNGQLIAAAEGAGHDVMLTADKNLRYQQNLAMRRLAIMALSTNHWKTIRRDVRLVVEALERVKPGAFVELDFSTPRKQRDGDQT